MKATHPFIRSAAVLLAILILTARPSYAIPWNPDMQVLEKAVKIFENVKQGGYKFSDTQQKDLELLIDSGDTFSLALAAYAVGNAPQKEDRLLELLKSTKSAHEFPREWPAAFIRLAEIKQGLLDKDDKYRTGKYEKIVTDTIADFANIENRYLAVEAAKEVLKLDKGKGVELLEQLQDDSNMLGLTEARRVLWRIKHTEQPWNSVGEPPSYDSFQQIVEGAVTIESRKFVEIDRGLRTNVGKASKQKP